MKTKVFPSKPISKEKTKSKQKLTNNLVKLTTNKELFQRNPKGLYKKSSTSNDNKSNNKKDNYLISVKQTADSEKSKRESINETKPKNTTQKSIDKTNLELTENIRQFEHLISRMFHYLKDKVSPDLYEEMKHFITDEMRVTSTYGEKKRKDSLSSVQDIINLVLNNKSKTGNDVEAEKLLDDMQNNLILDRDNSINNLKNGESRNELIPPSLNDENKIKQTLNKINSNIHSKNLKLSYDLSTRTTLTGNGKASLTPKDFVNQNDHRSNVVNKSSPKEKNLIKNTSSSQLININYKNPSNGLKNSNLKGYLNFCNHTIILNQANSEQQNVLNKGSSRANSKANLIPNAKASLFNIVKVGDFKTNSNINKHTSKTQIHSKSKSNSREANGRIVINSLSKQKLRTDSRIEESVHMNNEVKKINKPLGNTNIPQMYLKLNTKMARKTGFSPEDIRTNVCTEGSQQRENHATNHNRKYKQNKNFSNVSTHNQQSEHFQKANNKISKGTTITTKDKSLNLNSNLTTTINKKHNINLQKKKILNHNIQNIHTTAGRDEYNSINTNHSINESKRVNGSKNIMDLTYNVTIKDKDSTRHGNSGRDRDHHSRSIYNNNSNQNTKYIDVNEIGIINSEATITQKSNDLSELKEENKIKSDKISTELIKEIKLNLDDNLKNMFNFSYENFLKEHSESGFSTKKSEDLSENDINIQNYFRAGVEESIVKNSKKKETNYYNEISFDENDDKLKEMVFKK